MDLHPGPEYSSRCLRVTLERQAGCSELVGCLCVDYVEWHGTHLNKVLDMYSEANDVVVDEPVFAERFGQFCIAESKAMTAFNWLRSGNNMQYPTHNEQPCRDTELVSINNTHAIRKAFWAGDGKICSMDEAAVL